jgi:hypothetical protein
VGVIPKPVTERRFSQNEPFGRALKRNCQISADGLLELGDGQFGCSALGDDIQVDAFGEKNARRPVEVPPSAQRHNLITMYISKNRESEHRLSAGRAMVYFRE